MPKKKLTLYQASDPKIEEESFGMYVCDIIYDGIVVGSIMHDDEKIINTLREHWMGGESNDNDN
jgi:hypothetical protein